MKRITLVLSALTFVACGGLDPTLQDVSSQVVHTKKSAGTSTTGPGADAFVVEMTGDDDQTVGVPFEAELSFQRVAPVREWTCGFSKGCTCRTSIVEADPLKIGGRILFDNEYHDAPEADTEIPHDSTKHEYKATLVCPEPGYFWLRAWGFPAYKEKFEMICEQETDLDRSFTNVGDEWEVHGAMVILVRCKDPDTGKVPLVFPAQARREAERRAREAQKSGGGGERGEGGEQQRPRGGGE